MFKSKRKKPQFQVGKIIQVRAKEDISSTLDDQNKLEGCLFMDQMWKYCGLEYKVLKVIHTFLDESQYKMFKPRSPLYILDKLICDGHVNAFDHPCDRYCYLLWHEGWLEEVRNRSSGLKAENVTNWKVSSAQALEEPSYKQIISCQLMDILETAERNSWFNNIFQWSVNKLKRSLKRVRTSLKDIKLKFMRSERKIVGATAHEREEIQPGDRVKVKSREEIEGMLNARGEYKGCAFIREMYEHCDKEYRVLKKVNYFYDEAQQKMCKSSDMVILDGAHCSGRQRLYAEPCDRHCFFFWKTEWLKKQQ